MFQKSLRELLSQAQDDILTIYSLLPSSVQTLVEGEMGLGKEMSPEGNAVFTKRGYLSFPPFSRGATPNGITWKVLDLYKQGRFISQLDTSSVLDVLTCPGGCSESLGRVPGLHWVVLHGGTPATVGQGQSPQVLGFWEIQKEGHRRQFWKQHWQR